MRIEDEFAPRRALQAEGRMILGLELNTDCAELVAFMKAIVAEGPPQETVRAELERRFPGLLAAIQAGTKALAEKRFWAERTTYFCYRVQVWPAAKYDADPSPPIRVIPVFIDVD